ncbi:MAG: sulfurtransferase TusA family protein [Pacificimonas sp.]
MTIDARGMRCPLPVLRLRKIAFQEPAGTRLRLRADDPAAEADVPTFCEEMSWDCEGGDGEWFVTRP